MTLDTLAFGCDHAGFELKEFLKHSLATQGYKIIDCGVPTADAVDYPDLIPPVVKEVLAGAKGVLICGSGIGMSIGVNRFTGIRGALCVDSTMAVLSRTHNNANVLILGSRFMNHEEALACVEAFLDTPFQGEERHERRNAKLDHLIAP